ncbi:MAG: hypothetical protein LBM65_01910 [Oscillospiraceae bacterium]|nr:hypothetical protein [Oscillospiraceae bacterium]
MRFAKRGSDLYKLGERIAKEAFGTYAGQGLLNDMHTGLCYIRLYEYLTEAKATDIIDLAALQSKLQAQVKHSISANTQEWDTSYICKPSQFFNNPNSIFYADNKAVADYECEYIVKTQLDDGSWAIPWGWNDYPEEWAVAKNRWKANGSIVNLSYLKGMKIL